MDAGFTHWESVSCQGWRWYSVALLWLHSDIFSSSLFIWLLSTCQRLFAISNMVWYKRGEFLMWCCLIELPLSRERWSSWGKTYHNYYGIFRPSQKLESQGNIVNQWYEVVCMWVLGWCENSGQDTECVNQGLSLWKNSHNSVCACMCVSSCTCYIYFHIYIYI